MYSKYSYSYKNEKFFTDLGDTLMWGTRAPLIEGKHTALLQKEVWRREARSVRMPSAGLIKSNPPATAAAVFEDGCGGPDLISCIGMSQSHYSTPKLRSIEEESSWDYISQTCLNVYVCAWALGLFNALCHQGLVRLGIKGICACSFAEYRV